MRALGGTRRAVGQRPVGLVVGLRAVRARVAGGAVAALLGLVGAVSAAVPATPAGAQAQVGIEPTTLGNVFAEGGTPAFQVETAAPGTIRWLVHDHAGELVARGDEPVDGGQAQLAVPVEEVGYYVLSVTASADPAVAPVETTFAVVPAVDGGGNGDVRFGVQTHFGHVDRYWQPELVELVDAMGAATVRDSQPWQRIEQQDGSDEFGHYEEYMERLADHEIEPLVNFGFGNRWYDHGPEDPDEPPGPGNPIVGYTPHTADGRAGYAAFARRTLDHYPGAPSQIGQVGVYNEPNICRFGDWGEGGPANARPDEAAAMARAMSETLGDTGVTLVGPELAAGAHSLDEQPRQCGADYGWLEWLQRYAAQRGLDQLDVLSLHPYRHKAADTRPEGLTADLDEVRAVLDQHGADLPIWLTEQGWPNAGQGTVDEATQARYLPRTYVTALAAGADRLYWYNLKDDGTPPGPGDRAREFGLLHRDDTPKPAYVAYAVMTDQLGGLDEAGTDPAPPGVHSQRFGDGPDGVHVMWAPGGDTDMTLATGEPVQVTDALGATHTLEPDGGRVTLTVGPDVRYVRGAFDVV